MAFDNELNGSPRGTNNARNETSAWHPGGEALVRQLQLVDEQLNEWRETMRNIRANSEPDVARL